MSMLAERKRKQKWVIHQGNFNKQTDWSKDSNKFGQKLLERMGWKEGKGLGRNEDGMTNHIKVAFKGNSKGMGFKDSVEWSEQQDNYKMLLEELSSSKEDAREKLKEVKSLEEKSQNSHARLHYKKFTRGKDLSRYSEKDLANIFGKKKLTAEPVEENPVEVEEEKPDNLHGVVTVSGGCMMEYFKKKKLAKSNGVSSKSSSDLEEESPHFGFGFSSRVLQASEEDENSSCNGINAMKKGKKSKDKKKEVKNSFVSYVSTEDIHEITPLKKQETENQEETSLSQKKRKIDVSEAETPSNKKLKFEASSDDHSKKGKKSKKKSKGEETTTDLGLTNPAFEPLGTNILVKKHILNTITESEAESELNETVSEQKSKEKRKKSKYHTEPDQESRDVEEKHLEANSCEVQPKHKKKRKQTNLSGLCAIDNPSFNVGCDLEPQESAQEHEVKLKKKKKLKGVDNPALDDPNLDVAESQKPQDKNKNRNKFQSENLESHSVAQDYEVQRKKKKKSKGLDNPVLNLEGSITDFELHLEETQIEGGFEVKQKRKKTSGGLDNPALNLDDSVTDPKEVHIEGGYEVKQKKKKKKSKGLDNPALNLDDSVLGVVESQSQETQNQSDSEVKHKKKKKCEGLDNPALSLDDSISKLAESQLRETHHEGSYEVKSQEESKGLDNPALNLEDSTTSLPESQKKQDGTSLQNKIENTLSDIADSDIMLNVINELVTTLVPPKVNKYMLKNRSKHVRFSKTNREYVISDRSPGDIDKRNELYDINTKVIENGLQGLKNPKKGVAFDIKSVDKIDFLTGIDNRGFDPQTMEESIKALADTIDRYQAEVENDINESKDNNILWEPTMVGELNLPDGENEPHEEGVMLRYKYAMFNKKEPTWLKKNNVSATLPKKTYKHLIRGDIIVGFKDSNLHKINGYGMTKTGTID